MSRPILLYTTDGGKHWSLVKKWHFELTRGGPRTKNCTALYLKASERPELVVSRTSWVTVSSPLNPFLPTHKIEILNELIYTMEISESWAFYTMLIILIVLIDREVEFGVWLGEYSSFTAAK